MRNNFYIQKALFIAVIMICSINSFAQFSGAFAPANWNFNTTTAGGDGSVNTAGAPASIILNGSDNGVGCCAQYEQYSITIPVSGMISFNYSHVNPDVDGAYYVINGTATLITNGGSGTISNIAVNAGDVFSFRVFNQDNCCGRGVLTISNFVFISGVALNFDGVNDRVNLGTGITTSLTGGTKVSVEAWVKPTNLSGLGCIIGNYSTGSANLQVLLRRNTNSNYEFWVGNGTSWYQTTSAATPTVNVWQHVAATWNGTVASIYVNGVLSGTTTPALSVLGNAGSNPVWIGGNTINENFAGNIDEVRVWNVVRTQCEINTYKNCEIPTTAAGLIANYHFNQGVDAGTNTSVTTLTDASASAFTGTLTNMALTTGTISNWVAPGGVVSGSVTPANLAITVGSTVTNSVICLGNSTTLSGTGANTYAWTGGVTNAVAFTPTVTNTYTVTGTNTLTGCTNTAVSSVTVNTLPAVTVNSGAICAGQSFTMTPAGATTYAYSNGTDVVTPTANGSYTVTGTDANGCTNTAVSSVTVNTLPTVTVNSGAVCAGQSFTMTPAGATTYVYSSGTGVVTPTINNSYTVTGTDANGCVNTAVSSVTVNALPVLTAVTNNTLLCAGQTATLTVSGATTYTWSTSANTTTVAVSPTVQTTYTVNGTNANGCSNSTTVTQNVSACTGIASLSNDASITIYPNPNTGLFTVELTTISKVVVTNALGQIVVAETFEAGKHTVNINNETTGVYFVKVMTNNSQQTIKVIKE